LSVIGFLGGSYLLLVLGGLSMLLPFLIMLSSSVSNDWDYERYSPVPRYLYDRQERYMKFLAEKYLSVNRKFPRDFRLFSAAYRPEPQWSSFRGMREDPAFAEEPAFMFGAETVMPEQIERIGLDYEEWLATLDPLMTLPMFARFTRADYQVFMRRKYEEAYLSASGEGREDLSPRELEKHALAAMADSWQEARFTSFFLVEMFSEAAYPYHLREWLPPLDEQRFRDYLEFVEGLPPERKIPITAQHLWVRYLENSAGELEAFKAATGLTIACYAEVALPVAKPDNPKLRELWTTFVHEKWPLWMVRAPEAARPDYIDFLRERAGGLARLNRLVEADYASWDDVPFTGTAPTSALERNLWREFLGGQSPERLLRWQVSAESSYREFLEGRYGTVAGVNAACGWHAGGLDEIGVPIAEVDYGQFLDHETSFVRQCLTFNFRQVFGFMTVQGRALLNTFILVLLSIAATLTVNPLAAYALSRFRLRRTHQILLFLLATMAFPAEVSMIPNFLLLRELGFLNTFAALVLPGLASGFSIFLLKGFFDSLPGELFESATLDGASELTIFSRIVLPLTKPIMAYMALLSFMAAYGGFMWAFLVCQDKHMWTLMVWLYQYQQTAAEFPYMVMAAFVLGSIPTLLVFMFCQNIILRGIIIPTMK